MAQRNKIGKRNTKNARESSHDGIEENAKCSCTGSTRLSIGISRLQKA